jgi:hypothetical protein
MYSTYSGRVSLIAVAFDPSMTLEEAEEVRQQENWSFPVATMDPAIIKKLGVRYCSKKIAVDSSGVQIWRGGFGEGTAAQFLRVFDDLAASG